MELSPRESQETSTNIFSISHLAFFILFSLELISGIFLSFVYRSGSPYETTTQLHSSGWRFIQSFHYWASSLVIFFGLVLIITDLWIGNYSERTRAPFLATVLAFLSAYGFQLSGNLLPFDRHGAQTASIEAGIAARMPVLGDPVRGFILGGPNLSDHTVGIWYGMHLAITLGALASLAFAWKGRDLLISRKAWGPAGALSFVGLIVAVLIASPFGSKATPADFQGFGDKASWYTQPLHGSLMMMSNLNPSLGWIGAMAIPTLCVAALLLLPYVAHRLSPKLVRCGLALVAIYFLVAGARFGGSFDSLTGPRDPVTATETSTKQGSPIDKTLAAKGRALFNSASVGCAGCHGTDGDHGKQGPSLVNVFKRHPEADYYLRYVKNPQSVNANSTMPAFNDLPADQLKEIAEYLRSPR